MPRRWPEVAGVLAGAAAFVALADALTGETQPLWDGRRYVEMAKRLYDGRLVAPFAYRPAMPFAAHALSLAAHVPAETSMRAIGRVAAALALVLAYGSARTVGRARPGVAAFVAVCVGLSYYHVRFPLFFWSLVDVAAYPLMLVCFHWIWRGKTGRAGLLAALGLFFKEFLLVPWAVALVQGARVAWRRRSARRAAVCAASFALGAAVFAVPRAVLEVDVSRQWIDFFHDPDALAELGRVATDPAHLLAVAAALVSYWMPALLLASSARLAALREGAAGLRRPLLLHLLFLLPLVLFGGKNVDVFAAYAVAAEVLVLALMLRGLPPRAFEVALVLACLVTTNHWLERIPDPAAERAAYLAFHGFNDSALSAGRLGVCAAWIAGAALLRLALRRAAPVS